MLPLAMLLAIGCHASNPAFCPDGADEAGECLRPPDATTPCFGVAPFLVCVAPPTEPLVLARIDTDVNCDEIVMMNHEVCVVKGTDVTIGQLVPIRGTRPVVILASNELTIDASGSLDAAGAGTTPGAGADIACTTATAGADHTNGGGGGAGGTFGSRGGNGGTGNYGGSTTGKPGIAGMLAGAPAALQGGCSGTDAGNAGTPGTDSKGERGRAGGGVYLVAGKTLTLHGTINASGAGGSGGRLPRGGGGGGGSGGMIVLYAPTAVVSATAQILANGGGGGGGANSTAAGDNGTSPTAPLTAARGGNGQGGDGGNGAFLTMPATMGVSALEGGGGGGGGVGVIYILGGNFNAAKISPPPT